MASKVSLTFLDHSGEKSSVEYYVPNTDALNFAAQADDAVVGTTGGTATLIGALSLCTAIRSTFTAQVSNYTPTPPGSKLAQRENGLLVIYADNVTGAHYRITIPGPDWANIGGTGTDLVNGANAAWTAFKAQFEAEAVSPVGNPITVISGKYVGRNR